MGGDIGLFIGSDRLDLGVEQNDLALDSGLKTAVMLSLFTDQRAAVLELPPGETARRGWWADGVAEVVGDRHGSKLWLLAREKQTDDVAERAKEYCVEALQWMVDDGVAQVVNISTQFQARGILGIEVEIVRPSGDSTAFTFDFAWQSVAAG